MNFRKIKTNHLAIPVKLGNHQILQALPLSQLDQISPFILLHHFDFDLEAGDNSFYVPPHPHRGFCPITFMFEGSVEHHDSFGNQKVIGSNEVQWITAARGIIHSEKASAEMIANGGRYQGIQLWINLASQDKMKPASYQPITAEEMVVIEKKGIILRVVSGILEGQKGAAHSDTITAMLRMDENSEYQFQLPASHHSVIYVLEGEGIVNGSNYRANQLIWFESEDGDIVITAKKASKLLIMSGHPIDEPLVTHGPFVMNSETEILEAMRDYSFGKMGFLAY